MQLRRPVILWQLQSTEGNKNGTGFLFACHEHTRASFPDDYNPKAELAFMSVGRVI
ncbi:hypothetical protein LEMLEM_LOCUS19994 [Lemmus lemmus]